LNSFLSKLIFLIQVYPPLAGSIGWSLSYTSLSASGGFNWLVSRLKAWRPTLELFPIQGYFSYQRLPFLSKVTFLIKGYLSYPRLLFLSKVTFPIQGYLSYPRLPFLSKVTFPIQGYLSYPKLTFLSKVIFHIQDYLSCLILPFLSKVIRLWRVQLVGLQALSLESNP